MKTKQVYKTKELLCFTIKKNINSIIASNLDEKNVTNNKAFQKTIKPFFSNKITSKEKIA